MFSSAVRGHQTFPVRVGGYPNPPTIHNIMRKLGGLYIDLCKCAIGTMNETVGIVIVNSIQAIPNSTSCPSYLTDSTQGRYNVGYSITNTVRSS